MSDGQIENTLHPSCPWGAEKAKREEDKGEEGGEAEAEDQSVQVEKGRGRPSDSPRNVFVGEAVRSTVPRFVTRRSPQARSLCLHVAPLSSFSPPNVFCLLPTLSSLGAVPSSHVLLPEP